MTQLSLLDTIAELEYIAFRRSTSKKSGVILKSALHHLREYKKVKLEEKHEKT